MPSICFWISKCRQVITMVSTTGTTQPRWKPSVLLRDNFSSENNEDFLSLRGFLAKKYINNVFYIMPCSGLLCGREKWVVFSVWKFKLHSLMCSIYHHFLWYLLKVSCGKYARGWYYFKGTRSSAKESLRPEKGPSDLSPWESLVAARAGDQVPRASPGQWPGEDKQALQNGPHTNPRAVHVYILVAGNALTPCCTKASVCEWFGSLTEAFWKILLLFIQPQVINATATHFPRTVKQIRFSDWGITVCYCTRALANNLTPRDSFKQWKKKSVVGGCVLQRAPGGRNGKHA